MPSRDATPQPSGLRLRLGLLVGVITGLCVFGVLEYRNARLAGMHQEMARAQLLTVARSFDADIGPVAPVDPPSLGSRLRTLVRSHPGLERASIYRAERGGSTRAVATTAASPPRASRRELRPLETGRSQYSEGGSDAHRRGALLFPLRAGGRPVAVMELVMGLEPLDASLAHERAVGTAIAVAAAVLTALLAGAAIDLLVVGPIREVRLAAHRIARGRYDTRLRWTRTDEIGDLARAFDSMGANLQESHAQLKSLASVDPLTGVSNRRALRGSLRAELRRAEREHRPVALLALDLDHFKEVNDEHGHVRGDEALASVASAIGAELRPSDACGRIGGDEFMVVLPGTDREDAVGVGERLRTRVADLRLGSEDRRVTLSIGVAEFPLQALGDDDLMRMADLALYRAKEKGRDRCEVYAEPGGRALAGLSRDPGVTA